ncbi:hypothetical protein IDM40_09670 [Nocardiopsis sp. HNM0947]|uniref:Secreted protein n=1 Tax=Nocardiopsis coralli TaxID=2772213 RepID=A0ABR9P564_9ACTN|nr:hypothetical protein [Nocardiopsis coralli]MBE2998965.1 hypothetical protein [Nocardiopsis coralli]
MEGVLPTIALVVVVVTVGAITVAAHFGKDRVGELRAWARDNGWTYTDRHPAPLGDAVVPTEPGVRRSRHQHVLTGSWGLYRVTAFEHVQTVAVTTERGTGHAEHVHRVVAVRTPGVGTDLEIRRRAPHPGAAEGAPFGTAFDTSGGDSDFARSVLDGDLTAWLLADPRSRSLPVRFTGGYVLTWAPMQLDPERALLAADYLIDLLEHIPRQTWERCTGH